MITRTDGRTRSLSCFATLALCFLLAMPCLLRAETVPRNQDPELIKKRRKMMQERRQANLPENNSAQEPKPQPQTQAAGGFQPGEEELALMRDDKFVPQGIAPKQRLVLIRVLRQLNLSDEQKEKLERLRRETGEELITLNRARDLQTRRLDQALYREEFSQAEVDKREKELIEVAVEQIQLQTRIVSRMRQILTPEQGRRFRDLMQQEINRLPVLPLRPGAKMRP
ncbi:MAG: Spy/CpxP family protein refolding chaperone [Blastocatellia bacterium]